MLLIFTKSLWPSSDFPLIMWSPRKHSYKCCMDCTVCCKFTHFFKYAALKKNNLLPVCHRWLVILYWCCHAIYVTRSECLHRQSWDLRYQRCLPGQIQKNVSVDWCVTLQSCYSYCECLVICHTQYDFAWPWYNNSHAVVHIWLCAVVPISSPIHGWITLQAASALGWVHFNIRPICRLRKRGLIPQIHLCVEGAEDKTADRRQHFVPWLQ